MRKLVLWGHHIDEYQEMFALSGADLNGRILEYGCGASAVNTEITHQLESSKRIISCDPLFALDKETLYTKVTLIFDEMLQQIKKEQEKFDFSHVHGLDKLVVRRRQGMEEFFKDYIAGKKEKRYLALKENKIPFRDFSFDFALSSHYLFADLDNQDVEFHINALKELARVAKEVRVFPLIDRNGETSKLLGPVLLGLHQDEYGVEIRNVDYFIQPQGNAMLRVWAQHCQVI